MSHSRRQSTNQKVRKKVAIFDNLDDSAFNLYAAADEMIVDEGGIDLKVDGDFICSASFKDVDPFQLMYAIIPEDFELPEFIDKEEWDQAQRTMLEAIPEATEEEKQRAIDQAETTARAALDTLAALKGWEKP